MNYSQMNLVYTVQTVINLLNKLRYLAFNHIGYAGTDSENLWSVNSDYFVFEQDHISEHHETRNI